MYWIFSRGWKYFMFMYVYCFLNDCEINWSQLRPGRLVRVRNGARVDTVLVPRLVRGRNGAWVGTLDTVLVPRLVRYMNEGSVTGWIGNFGTIIGLNDCEIKKQKYWVDFQVKVNKQNKHKQNKSKRSIKNESNCNSSVEERPTDRPTVWRRTDGRCGGGRETNQPTDGVVEEGGRPTNRPTDGRCGGGPTDGVEEGGRPTDGRVEEGGRPTDRPTDGVEEGGRPTDRPTTVWRRMGVQLKKALSGDRVTGNKRFTQRLRIN